MNIWKLWFIGMASIALQAFQASGQPAVLGYTGSSVFNTGSSGPNSQKICGLTVCNIRWYAYIGQLPGVLRFRTDGSTYDTVVGVYTGCCQFSTLTPVGCDDNGGRDGVDSYVQAPIVPGVVYYIAVAGVGSAHGTTVVSWDFAAFNITNVSKPAGDFVVSVRGPALAPAILEVYGTNRIWTAVQTLALDATGQGNFRWTSPQTYAVFRVRHSTIAGVVSANAYGYYRDSAPSHGWLLLANPFARSSPARSLDSPSDGIIPAEGLLTYRFDLALGGWQINSFSFGEWDYSESPGQLGDGFYLQNGTETSVPFVLKGSIEDEVVVRTLPAGFSLLGSTLFTLPLGPSTWPLADRLTEAKPGGWNGFPVVDEGTTAYAFHNGMFSIWTYDTFGGLSPLDLYFGEGLWLSMPQSRTWRIVRRVW